MAVKINSNIQALTAQRYLNKSTNELETSLERLSSGSRINSAKDDAAGLQISNRLISQNEGLDVAIRNANDGVSIAQTAESAMQESTSILQRMRDLALQATNGTNGESERKAIQQEIIALQDELNRIAETTSFGGLRLLNGTYGEAAFQIGAASGEAINIELLSTRADENRMGGLAFIGTNEKSADWVLPMASTLNISFIDASNQTIELNIIGKKELDIESLATYINGQVDNLLSASVNENGKIQLFFAKDTLFSEVVFSGSLSSSLGLTSSAGKAITAQDVDVTTVGGAQMAIGVADASMQYLDSIRANLGATQNRLEQTIDNLSNVQVNITASNSRIRDTDFAEETTKLTREQILQQAGIAVLAQAKQLPEAALTLLQ